VNVLIVGRCSLESQQFIVTDFHLTSGGRRCASAASPGGVIRAHINSRESVVKNICRSVKFDVAGILRVGGAEFGNMRHGLTQRSALRTRIVN
jgi:hypothetical protein